MCTQFRVPDLVPYPSFVIKHHFSPIVLYDIFFEICLPLHKPLQHQENSCYFDFYIFLTFSVFFCPFCTLTFNFCKFLWVDFCSFSTFWSFWFFGLFGLSKDQKDTKKVERVFLMSSTVPTWSIQMGCDVWQPCLKCYFYQAFPLILQLFPKIVEPNMYKHKI